MATFNKFECFVGDLGTKAHDLNADVLKVYLTNAAPSASLDSVKADLTEITAENGYPSGGGDIQNVYTETGGVGTLTATDVVFTASGGAFGPFQYVVIYNDTSTSDSLIGWCDYGSPITINDSGDPFTVDFGATVLTIT